MPRAKRKDFSGAESLSISRSACVSIAASAAEVFPKECMGCLGGIVGSDSVAVAIPYQLAKRKAREVVSSSPDMFKELLGGHYVKFADYHSHTFEAYEDVLELEPSSQDMQEIKHGEVEIIIQMTKSKSSVQRTRQLKDGSISGSLGRFRFLIRAFVRIRGVDKFKFPRYKVLRLVLS